ncbi:MAG: ATP-grasp domain-containing protein [Bacteroidetes bacterium]|nr:ATP-grasp domain-containing protein [Bacteroidota bacterium]
MLAKFRDVQYYIDMGAALKKISVVVLYNHIGDDMYEQIKQVDPATLDFMPEYNIHVATVSEEYTAIVTALKKEGYRVRLVNIAENLSTLQNVLRRNPPDVIFNLVEFIHDSHFLESAVAGMFEVYKIAYTGCSPFSLELCMHKGIAKQLLQANNVPTPKFISLNELSIPKQHGLTYPLIIKPALEDASSGVDKDSVVYNYEELTARLEKIFKEFHPPILVEEYIEGRELHVSILGNNPPRILPPIEFDFTALPKDFPNIITYDAKWNPLKEEFHRVHAVCPAELTKTEMKKVEQVSLAAYKILQCRDYARLDLRLGKDQNVYVLEVNPNPDLTEGVSFMESAEHAGLSFSETLSMIVDFAYQRKLLRLHQESVQRELAKKKLVQKKKEY